MPAWCSSRTSSPAWRSGPTSAPPDRKSTRLNSSHEWISYAVFCLKKKKKAIQMNRRSIAENEDKGRIERVQSDRGSHLGAVAGHGIAVGRLRGWLRLTRARSRVLA